VALPIEQFICMRDKGDSLDNGESIDNYEIQIYSSDPVAQKTTILKLHTNFTCGGQFSSTRLTLY
jgi:hypothetical protein